MVLAVPFVIVAALMAADTVQIERWIDQLGSEAFTDREAATKALDRLGLPALEPLRQASERSDDTEIRRRAERLVKAIEERSIVERALALRRSRLSPEEKGRKLRALLKVGMTHDEVSPLLGFPSNMAMSGGCTILVYSEYSLTIFYDQSHRVDTVK